MQRIYEYRITILEIVIDWTVILCTLRIMKVTTWMIYKFEITSMEVANGVIRNGSMEIRNKF